jgi:hypothetical protein
MPKDLQLTLVLLLSAVVVLQVWNMVWRWRIQRDYARRQAEQRALQQFILDTNRELKKVMDDTDSPLAQRWARAEALLAEVAARNPTSDPGIKDWIEDNRAYFEEQVGRKP